MHQHNRPKPTGVGSTSKRMQKGTTKAKLGQEDQPGPKPNIIKKKSHQGGQPGSSGISKEIKVERREKPMIEIERKPVNHSSKRSQSISHSTISLKSSPPQSSGISQHNKPEPSQAKNSSDDQPESSGIKTNALKESISIMRKNPVKLFAHSVSLPSLQEAYNSTIKSEPILFCISLLLAIAGIIYESIQMVAWYRSLSNLCRHAIPGQAHAISKYHALYFTGSCNQ